jgi:carbon starvation protein CstA
VLAASMGALFAFLLILVGQVVAGLVAPVLLLVV